MFMDIMKSSADIANSAVARFAVLAEGTGGKIFAEADEGVDILKVYRENAVILFLINNFEYAEFSRSLGNLVILDAKKCVAQILKQEHSKRSLFLFDELGTYVSDQVINLLNKARSASVQVIPAVQSLSDIDKTSEFLTKQIIENCHNYIVFKVNESTGAETLANTFGTRTTVSRTHQVDDYHGNTGMGTTRLVEEYVVNPNEIKNLPLKTGIFVSKQYGGEPVKFTCRFVNVS
jgi:type IV secretory pathway TraG/TraD family ATPase VirD4